MGGDWGGGGREGRDASWKASMGLVDCLGFALDESCRGPVCGVRGPFSYRVRLDGN